MAQARRRWVHMLGDFESEDAFREEVCRDLMGVEWAGHRLGRGFLVAPLRVQDEEGEYYTAGWIFEDQFMPAVQRRLQEEAEAEVEPEPEMAPEPEPEPVGVE